MGRGGEAGEGSRHTASLHAAWMPRARGRNRGPLPTTRRATGQVVRSLGLSSRVYQAEPHPSAGPQPLSPSLASSSPGPARPPPVPETCPLLPVGSLLSAVPARPAACCRDLWVGGRDRPPGAGQEGAGQGLVLPPPVATEARGPCRPQVPLNLICVQTLDTPGGDREVVSLPRSTASWPGLPIETTAESHLANRAPSSNGQEGGLVPGEGQEMLSVSQEGDN